jgi:predicted RNA-binding protein
LKKGSLPFTGILGDEPPQAWKNDLDQLAFKGNPLIEEVLFLHKPSRTVILDDLIQIHPRVKGKVFRNALFKLEGVQPPDGGVGLDIRLSFIHRNFARQSLERLLSWEFDKLIIAHGPCIEKDAKAFVERAFRWLAR